MGDTAPSEADLIDHRPAHILLHGTRSPPPEEIRDHPEIDAEPVEVYQYRQTRAVERQANAVSSEAYYTEMIVQGLILLGGVALLSKIADQIGAPVRY